MSSESTNTAPDAAAPPMSREEWGRVQEFDRMLKSKLGTGIIDYQTLAMLEAYRNGDRTPQVIPGKSVDAATPFLTIG